VSCVLIDRDTLTDKPLSFGRFQLVNFPIEKCTIAKLSAAPRMKLLIIVLFIAGTTIAVAGLYRYRIRRAMEQARARGAWLTKELERIDSRIEVVEIWSDEQIEGNNRQLANEILENVGTDLFADDTVEARRLRTFLSKVRQTEADSELKTARDLGLAWFACLQLEDKDPESQLAQLFKEMNEAWAATREGKVQIHAPDKQTIMGAIASTLVQSRTPS
jgi:hypothetical protein